MFIDVQNETYYRVFTDGGDFYVDQVADCTVTVSFISWFLFSCLLDCFLHLRTRLVRPPPKLEEKQTFSAFLWFSYFWYPSRIYACSVIPEFINVTHYSEAQAIFYDLRQGHAVLAAVCFGVAYLLHAWITAPRPRFRQLTTEEPHCSICMEDYTEEAPSVAPRNCQHCFHAACITPWFYVDPVCPLCRKEM